MRSKSGTKMKQRTFLRERREFELAKRGKVAAARYCFSKSAFGFKIMIQSGVENCNAHSMKKSNNRKRRDG